MSMALTINGKAPAEILEEAEAVRAAKVKRAKELAAESHKRIDQRTAAAKGGGVAVGRSGSSHRGSYTAVQKMKILYVYDQICEDPGCPMYVYC